MKLKLFDQFLKEKPPTEQFQRGLNKLIERADYLDYVGRKSIQLSQKEASEIEISINYRVHISLPAIFKKCTSDERKALLQNLVQGRKYYFVGEDHPDNSVMKISNIRTKLLELEKVLTFIDKQLDQQNVLSIPNYSR